VIGFGVCATTGRHNANSRTGARIRFIRFSTRADHRNASSLNASSGRVKLESVRLSRGRVVYTPQVLTFRIVEIVLSRRCRRGVDGL
jgi:hypothetical protein